MVDVFIERMVKRKIQGTDALIFAAIIAGVIVVSAIGLFVGLFVISLPSLVIIVTAAAIFGGYKLICLRLLEYEYSLTNGYVTVDKIMNRSSRKRLTAFDCDSCEDIGEYRGSEERLKNRSFDARIFATQYSDCRNSWYMIVRGKKTGKTLVVFDPDEDFIEAVKKFIPRSLKFEKFGRA